MKEPLEEIKTEERIEALREKNHEAMGRADFREALSYRLKIIDTGYGNLGDYHGAGQMYFELGEYDEAVEVLTRCLEEGEKQDNFWYEGSCLLLRSYSYAKAAKKERAFADIGALEKYSDDTSITWLKNHDVICVDSIMSVINRLE